MPDSSAPVPIRCWEYLSCGRGDCGAHSSNDPACWLVDQNHCFTGSVPLSERLMSKCLECQVFTANRVRSIGKRQSDAAMIKTLDALFVELGDTISRVESLKAESRYKSAQVSLLSEVGHALQSTMELDELLRVILTAVTAGGGFGFNRAFLLLLDDDGSAIRGRMAVGPTHPSEADRIWNSMREEGKSLGEILRSRRKSTATGDDGIMKIARDLVFPFDGDRNVIARSLAEGKSSIIRGSHDAPGVRDVVSKIGNDHFLVVPLLAEGTKLGVILADNFVTRRRIGDEDVRLLETFASQAALAIVNASLHEKLRDRVRQLEEAHAELSLNHLQLLRAERLVALGGLAASFTHDLKGPLVSIGLMARSTASQLPEGSQARHTLDMMAAEILSMESYLKGLASSTSRNRGKQVPVDLGKVITHSVELMSGTLCARQVKTRIDLKHGSSRVRGCQVELRQMILNLLHNAVEAMPEGGTLAVETGVENGSLKITVKDTGVGIPKDVMPRVFSIFFTTKAEGSGLGLYIVKRIVNDHGGTITCESKEGGGTCFSIFLPITA